MLFRSLETQVSNNNWQRTYSQQLSQTWNSSRYSAWRQTDTSNTGAAITREFSHAYALEVTTSAAGPWRKVSYTPYMQPQRSETSAGARMYYDYDRQGQLEAVHASANDAAARSTHYAWHPAGTTGAGQLATITDALGRQSRFDYDAAGHLIRHTLPDGRATHYQRDAAGQLIQLCTSAGV